MDHAKLENSQYVLIFMLCPGLMSCRGDTRKVYVLHRHALNSEADNVLLPVKFLLVNAIRQGSAHGNSVQHVL
jgi:hypothetical protein